MSSNRRWPKVISRSASSAHFSPMTFIAASIEQTRGSAILGVRTLSEYAWTSGFAMTIHLDRQAVAVLRCGLEIQTHSSDEGASHGTTRPTGAGEWLNRRNRPGNRHAVRP